MVYPKTCFVWVSETCGTIAVTVIAAEEQQRPLPTSIPVADVVMIFVLVIVSTVLILNPYTRYTDFVIPDTHVLNLVSLLPCTMLKYLIFIAKIGKRGTSCFLKTILSRILMTMVILRH